MKRASARCVCIDAIGSLGTNHTSSTAVRPVRPSISRAEASSISREAAKSPSNQLIIPKPAWLPVGTTRGRRTSRGRSVSSTSVARSELGAGQVVRPQRDERAEHLVALRVGHRELEAAGVVARGFGAPGAFRRHREEAPAQAEARPRERCARDPRGVQQSARCSARVACAPRSALPRAAPDRRRGRTQSQPRSGRRARS